jgi:amino acid transporter
VNQARPEAASNQLAHRELLYTFEAWFALFGGPIAWFVQLCAGFALASEPCFAAGERMKAPLGPQLWTASAMTGLLLASILIAMMALWVSWLAFTRTRAEGEGDHRQVMEVGSGRSRFLALWGIFLSAGFAIATLLTAAGLYALPRCAG